MTNDIIFDYDKCRTDIFENGEFVVALDIPKIQANALCVALTERSDSYDFDWQYSGGRVCVRQLRRKDDGISSQWISVDDALPSEDGAYLVVVKNWASHIDTDRFCADDSSWEFFNNSRLPKITHWMPLPAPPNNEAKGDRHDS